MKFLNEFSILILLIFFLGCSATLTKFQEKRIDNLEKDTEEKIVNIQEKLVENPNSALEKSLALLDKIMNYTDAVRNDPRKFSEEKINEFNKRIVILNGNIERFLDLKLDSDISFKLGKYKLEDLTELAKLEIEKLISEIIKSANNVITKYPQEKVIIYLKIVGYTDETPFKEGTILERDILKVLNYEKPSDPTEKRKKYNQVLSSLRADTLNKYTQNILTKKLIKDKKNSIKVINKCVGLGEKLPKKDIQISYKPTDKRRRICIISPLIEIE